jgi:drug/metabolite transporter (DMT)-like permease
MRVSSKRISAKLSMLGVNYLICACLGAAYAGFDLVRPDVSGFSTTVVLGAVGGIAYLGLFATALCLYMQSYGLKYAEPAIGGMILSLESVFGVLFSVIIYHERITFRMLVGFAVIFVAILLSQWEGKQQPAEAETAK